MNVHQRALIAAIALAPGACATAPAPAQSTVAAADCVLGVGAAEIARLRALYTE